MTEMKPNLKRESEWMPESKQMQDSLKAAMPRMAEDAEPARDLWPEVLRRLDSEPRKVPWFDWALVAGLVALAAAFPSAIPVVLYYL